MITRSTISPYPTMRAAHAAILSLESSYLKTNKRRNTIDLVLSSTSKPVYDDRGRPKLTNELIEVRAVYDDKVAAQVAEYEWFAAAVKSI